MPAATDPILEISGISTSISMAIIIRTTPASLNILSLLILFFPYFYHNIYYPKAKTGITSRLARGLSVLFFI